MDAKLTYSAVWRSAPPYPHTEHPSGDKGKKRTVTFLGPQVLYEQLERPPGERRVETENVCYTFAYPKGMIERSWISVLSTDEPSFTECDTFREDVWGKQLLTRAGVRAVIWRPLREANTLSISLWKERTGPVAFSIVFRALKKGTGKHAWELIELGCKISFHVADRKTLTPFHQVGRPKAYKKQHHEHLYLNLDPASAAAQVAKPKKAYEKLKITFDKEQGERRNPI